jgi:hypothetical protein
MKRIILTLGGLASIACSGTSSTGTDTLRTPLVDLGSRTYHGFEGGLYPHGSNTPPPEHLAEGLARAKRIRPLDAQGNPSASGKIVFLSLGMSNATDEFCSMTSTLPCDAWSFMGQAAAAEGVNKGTLAIANGAASGQIPNTWNTASSSNYDRVRDTVLVPQGLSEAQVQVLWVKEANIAPKVSLPSPDADAYEMERGLAEVVRAAHARYPNLQQIFFTSRIYGGFAITPLSPEPYAYETGFGVKWLIQAQIDQMANGGAIVDAQAGDLAYGTTPWLGWSAYLWAEGMSARSDGLTWSASDFQSDGTHPSMSGRRKVGAALLEFLETSELTRCWFMAGGSCG